MNTVDVIVKQVDRIKHKIMDNLTIRISEEKLKEINSFELSDKLRILLGMKVKINVLTIKHTTEEKIKLAMRSLAEEQTKQKPDKKKLTDITKLIDDLGKEKATKK